MARWEHVAGCGIAQPEDCYSSWQSKKLELQLSAGYQGGNWNEQPQSPYCLSWYSCGYTLDANGLSLPSGSETPLGSCDVPKETTSPDESQDEEALEDPNLHMNIEELNKAFMVDSEELFDSLMNCHWQPLDTVYSHIPDTIPGVQLGGH